MVFHIKIPAHFLPGMEFKQNQKVEFGRESLKEKREEEIIIHVSEELSIKPSDIFKVVKVSLAQQIEEGVVVAEKGSMFSTHAIRSPKKGEVRSINHSEGTLVIVSTTSIEVPFYFNSTFEKREGESFVFKVDAGKEYEVNVALPKTFGGETVYLDDVRQIDLATCENKIAISMLSSTMDSAKIVALSPVALVTMTADYYTADVPCIQLKDKKEWSEFVKHKWEKCMYLEGGKTIIFYN